jgi:hypothetical protein
MGFQGRRFGTPLTEFRGLIRRSSNVAEGAPGKVANVHGGCDQYDKTGQCVRFHVNQEIEGAGSYALARYYPEYVEQPAFPGSGVDSIQVEYYFCAHAVGQLPNKLAPLLILCGGQYGFPSEKLADQLAREAHNLEQINIMERELQHISPNDPSHGRLQSLLRHAQIQDVEYESPEERVTDWLISQLGKPIGYKPRALIRVQSVEGEIVTRAPPYPQFIVHRWCEANPWRLDPTCPVAVTLACELHKSGWCTVVVATSWVYGFTYAANELCNKNFAWLYQLLYEDEKHFALTPQVRGSECGTLVHRVDSRTMSKRELKQFEPNTSLATSAAGAGQQGSESQNNQ